MKKRSRFRTILLVLLLVLVLIQFIPVDRSTPEYDSTKDFIAMTAPPDEIGHLLKVACYDCHSYNVRYPWYSYVSPFSIWIQKKHIDHGREHLNFSIWGTYDADKQDHKLEECVEMVEEKAMPLNSYLWMHSPMQSLTDCSAGAKWRRGLTGFR